MPTTNIIRYEKPWLISEDTNYQGYRVNLETGETVPTGKRVLSKWATLESIFPGLVNGKSFMDIGCAQGFFLWKAIQCHAEFVIGIEKRETYYGELAKHITENMRIVLHNASFPHLGYMHADIVLCLSLVHHLFPVLTLEETLVELAHYTDETLLVEFIGREDKMVQRKGWGLEHPEYSEAAFLESAKANFAKVELVGLGHHNTRKIYRMDK